MTSRGSLPAALLGALGVCLALGSGTTASSQLATAPTTPLATAQDVDALLGEAGTLLRSSKIDEARRAFERAREAAQRLGLDAQHAAALCGVGQALVQNTRLEDARAYGLRCLDIHERLAFSPGIGDANLLIGGAAELLGNRAEAEARAKRALEAYASVGDLRGRGRATVNLLRVAAMDENEVLRLIARAVDDARATGDRAGEATALHSWGDELFSRGQYEGAFERLERARSLYQEAGDTIALGTVLNSVGRVYRAHGRLTEALKYQRQALDLHRTAGNPLIHLQSLNAVAVVHGLLGHVRESRDFYERALTLAEQSSLLWVQDFLRANIASVLSDLGDFRRAARIFEEVIARSPDTYPSVRHTQLSQARLALGQTREALVASERAVTLCGTAATDCIAALRSRARARVAAGDRRAALADVTDALGRIEDVRKRLVPSDFLKQEFHRAQEGIYSEAIALGLDDAQDARALETAELARSRAFLDLLAARDGEHADPVVVRSPTASADGTDLRSAVAASPGTFSDIAASARRLGSTFVLYWIADDSVTAWVVTASGSVQSRRTRVLRSRLDELIRATTPLPDDDGSPASRPIGAWRQLYDILIQPVRAALPKTPGSLITIVPHGALQGLSFAALRDGRGRYLLEDYAIHYAPAASVFQFTSAMKRHTGREGDLLLVADPVLPARSRLDRALPRLPGARAEVDAIARLVPQPRVTALRDAKATEVSVRAAGLGKAVLHFATHAIVRDDDPFGSFIALGSAAGGADADGRLTPQEVYAWNLRADLIVLSACRSGGGRITGDGVATFARAFMYAGTPSLVASLWDVADEPGQRLFPAFYRAWFAGQSKARSLRVAQLQLMRNLRAGRVQVETAAGLVALSEDPVLWAGFALIGEPE